MQSTTTKTLLDEFAMAALQTDYVNKNINNPEWIANAAYLLAHEMMKASLANNK
jgi:hypothetical protein